MQFPSRHISTVLSFTHLPVCHSPLLHLLSISPPVLPKPLLYPIAPLHPSLFPHALTLSFFSPPLSPCFLSIHTTESLLIICDLLKYIHCHSLSLPLSSLPLPPCPVFCSATSSHYSFPLSFSLSLFLSLGALSVSFVFLFCRIICVLVAVLLPPLFLFLYRREVTNTHWDTASWSVLYEPVGGKGWNPFFCNVAAETAQLSQAACRQ